MGGLTATVQVRPLLAGVAAVDSSLSCAGQTIPKLAALPDNETAPSLLYIANDNLFELDALADAGSSEYINDATVTLTAIRDAAGDTVSGDSFPITLAYVAASNGQYQGVADDGLALVAGRTYTAVIDVDSDDSDGHWEIPLRAVNRTN